MTPNPHDIEALASKLTEAQRRWLTERAINWMNGFEAAALHTFPPYATSRVLERLGLWKPSGIITETGLLLCAHLQSQSQESRDG